MALPDWNYLLTGPFRQIPETTKLTVNGKGSGYSYALTSVQGYRHDMEDCHILKVGFPYLKDWAFFGVFDGHSGAQAASRISEILVECILDTDEFKGIALNDKNLSFEPMKAGLRQGFLDADVKLRTLPGFRTGDEPSGTTACCALISPTYMFVANCGDSRGIHIRDKSLNHSSVDHKPENNYELSRVRRAGGYVSNQRINGSIAVSRSLGDYSYKKNEERSATEQLISPEPDIKIIERSGGDHYIMLACDGVWDVFPNSTDMCKYLGYESRIRSDEAEIADIILESCLAKESRDNMTILLIRFDGAPELFDSFKEREENFFAKTLREKLRSYVHMPKHLFREPPVRDVSSDELEFVFKQILRDEKLCAGLPPGLGPFARKKRIEALYKELKREEHEKEEAAEAKK